MVPERMLPILMLACLGVIVVMISLLFACFANEPKLIAIIRRSEKQP